MKRVFYIANAYDGKYFVLSDNIEEYFERLAAYALNLQNSTKTNHYSFGSVEMTEQEYQQQRQATHAFEREQIAQKESVMQEENDPSKVEEFADHGQTPLSPPDDDELPDNVIPLFQ